MIIIVRCQKCDAETKLSLADLSYEGLFHCWKCRQPHIFVVENDEIKLLKQLNHKKHSEQLELGL